MKKLILAGIGVFLLGSTAMASHIDFATPDFISGRTEFSIKVDDVNMTLKAGTNPQDTISPATLFWDNGTGFGVQHGYAQKEIESQEFLKVSFDVTGKKLPFILQKVFISELFNENGYAERGKYQLGGSTGVSPWVDFSADGGATNGKKTLEINQPVNWITFSAPGMLQNGENHEFALQGIQGTPAPLPPAIVLFASGIFGLAALKRRFKG